MRAMRALELRRAQPSAVPPPSPPQPPITPPPLPPHAPPLPPYAPGARPAEPNLPGITGVSQSQSTVAETLGSLLWLWLLLLLLCLCCCLGLWFLLCWRRRKAKDDGAQVLIADILAMPAFVPAPPPMEGDVQDLPLHRRIIGTGALDRVLSGFGGIKRLVLSTSDLGTSTQTPEDERRPTFTTHTSSTASSPALDRL